MKFIVEINTEFDESVVEMKHLIGEALRDYGYVAEVFPTYETIHEHAKDK